MDGRGGRERVSKAIADDRSALEIGYRELPEIATPQVCKYDTPRRRRLGRVTTERRITVGAERERWAPRENQGRERRLEA
jgi:hypothetical protein